jgi:hypothetical protein
MTNPSPIRSYQSNTIQVPGQERDRTLSATNSSTISRLFNLKFILICSVVAATVLVATYSVFPFNREQRKNSLQIPQQQEQKDKNVQQKHHEILTVAVEGKHKKNEDCDDGKYSKRTLQFAYELPFAALYDDNKGQKTYEASSIVKKDDNFYAVCDNSWAISKFTTKLTPFSKDNVQLGTPYPEDAVDESGYESIFWDKDSFYVVRESVEHDDSDYHAVVEQITLGLNDYTVVEKCSTEFEFEGTGKGFEGAVSLRDTNNELIILGLCEGNYCSQKYKSDAGHGRVVVMKKRTVSAKKATNTTASCEWETIKTIHLPKSAYFRDYSDIAINDKGRVAITSQEDSQLWVGQLLGQDPATKLWNVDEMELDSEDDDVYDFPKNSNCETIYCNIEGVEWLNDEMIVAVSDKMKGKGKQDFLCFDKDQSVHVFVLP